MLLVFSQCMVLCSEVFTAFHKVDSWCCYLKINCITILLTLAKYAPSF